MKKFLIICASIVGIEFLMNNVKVDEPAKIKYENQNSIAHLSSIRVVVYQDVSGSIKENGVEIISSSVFSPYFAETERTVELSFGVIADSSARKLITVSLPARAFCAPSTPNLDRLTITEQLDTKSQYYGAEKRYVADSVAYFTDRRQRIMGFQRQVDALLRVYRDHPTPRTDIQTALLIADKQFTSSRLDSSQDYLLLNSDGLDSRHAHLGALKNSAMVILINASGIASPALDALHPVNLQSVEQAIQFTLHNNQKNILK